MTGRRTNIKDELGSGNEGGFCLNSGPRRCVGSAGAGGPGGVEGVWPLVLLDGERSEMTGADEPEWDYIRYIRST